MYDGDDFMVLITNSRGEETFEVFVKKTRIPTGTTHMLCTRQNRIVHSGGSFKLSGSSASVYHQYIPPLDHPFAVDPRVHFAACNQCIRKRGRQVIFCFYQLILAYSKLFDVI